MQQKHWNARDSQTGNTECKAFTFIFLLQFYYFIHLLDGGIDDPVHIWDLEGNLSKCFLPYHPVDPGDQSKIFSLNDYNLYPLSHLTSPKVMLTTLQYWSGSNSVLPQAHDVPRSSRKSTHIFVLAKCIIRCYSTREKEPSIWKAEDTDSARLLLTPDDLFWCFSGWTLTMMRDETNDFHYNLDRCKISREQCFSCYPLEGQIFFFCQLIPEHCASLIRFSSHTAPGQMFAGCASSTF